MSSERTQLLCNNFTGIKRKEAIFSSDCISCSDCQNIELYYTNQNNGVGIRTSSGNRPVIDTLLDGSYKIYGMFEATMNTTSYMFLYAVSDDETKASKILYFDDITNTCEEVTDIKGHTKYCSATTFEQGWLDMFILSNGVEMKYIYVDTRYPNGFKVLEAAKRNESGKYVQGNDTFSVTVEKDNDTVIEYHPFISNDSKERGSFVDNEDRVVCGLGLVSFDQRLWVFKGNILWWSQKAECRRFDVIKDDYDVRAGFVEFSRNITSIHVYNGQLAVFFKDGYRMVTGADTSLYNTGTEFLGGCGCAELDSLVFHGTDLFFYDDVKKGIYTLGQTITGDTSTADNFAENISAELNNISPTDVGKGKLKALSVITNDRSEMWFLVPHRDKDKSLILIYDYKRNAWLKRVSNKITAMCVFNNKLYTAYDTIFLEYTSKLFGKDRMFIPAFYKCSTLTLASDNTLKITKFPPRLTIESAYGCTFNVQYIKNYNSVNPAKDKNIKAKTLGNTAYWVETITAEDGTVTYKDDYNNKVYTTLEECPYRYVEDGYDADTLTYEVSNYAFNANSIVKLPSITFKALDIKFYTTKASDSFSFKAFEFTKIKVKQI